MRKFRYIRPDSVQEAGEILAELGSAACVLAGGTDLLIEFRRPGASMPKAVVDISHIRELGGIERNNGSILIRPLVTHALLQSSSIVQRGAHLLSCAAGTIGSPQIRNRGTVGGNIINAAACADTVPPLVALDATIALQSTHGIRRMKLSDLFTQPYQTKAEPDELLVEIRCEALPSNARSAFIKLGRRNALSISRLSVATVLWLDDDGRISKARIVPGSAFPTWRRVTEAEDLLPGERPSRSLFAAAGERVSEAMIAATGRRWSTEYKEPVIATLVRRALEQSCEVAA